MKKEIKEKIIEILKRVEGGCVFLRDKEIIADQILELFGVEIAEAEKRGEIKYANEVIPKMTEKWQKYVKEARKEIVSEVEKWAKENKVYDFVKLETLLSKLKELK
jgi:hypothetical protein